MKTVFGCLTIIAAVALLGLAAFLARYLAGV